MADKTGLFRRGSALPSVRLRAGTERRYSAESDWGKERTIRRRQGFRLRQGYDATRWRRRGISKHVFLRNEPTVFGLENSIYPYGHQRFMQRKMRLNRWVRF